MRDDTDLRDMRETAGVLAGLVGGMALMVLVLLVSVGSGFLAAMLVLAVVAVAYAVLAIDDVAGKVAARRAVAPAAVPERPVWAAITRGVAGAVAIVVVPVVVMTAVRGPAHMLADLSTHAPYVALVALGGGMLAAAAGARVRQGAERWAVVVGGLGVVIALVALTSCCLWALVYQWPLVSLLVLALVFNEVPVALAGLALNALGLLVLARERQPATSAVS